MPEIRNTKEISVSVSPWTDEADETGEVEFSLMMLRMHEIAYGKAPGGKMELIHTGKKDVDEYLRAKESGVIKISDKKENSDYPGLTYEINFFITSRNYINNILTVYFTILPPGCDIEKGKNFYTALLSETYPDIEAAITSAYPSGSIDKRCNTDISEGVRIYRDDESSFDLICRLGMGWAQDGFFALGWDGLLLKKVKGINSFGKSETQPENLEKVISGQEEWVQVSYNTLKYNREVNYDLFNPWQDPNKDEDSLSKSTTPQDEYKELEPKYVTSSIKTNKEYKIHAKDYDVLQQNIDRNKTFSEAGGYATVTIVGEDMPRLWKLGDVVLYQRQTDEDKDETQREMLVVSNEVFFSQNGASEVGPHGKRFEWTTVLWGIERGDWTKENEEK